MRRTMFLLNRLCCSSILMLAAYAKPANGQSVASVYQATLMESDQKTKETSTVELRKILAEKSAVVFDARPFKEYAISHIPSAVNVSAKPGVPMSFYVSDTTDIGRVLKGDQGAAIVLYCNGPFCGKSKRLAAELLEAGYTKFRGRHRRVALARHTDVSGLIPR